MNTILEYQREQNRRQFLGDCGLRLGAAGLALLAASESSQSNGQEVGASPRPFPPLQGLPHHKPRAKSLIYLHMNGGPTQIDLWDHKPELVKHFKKNLPESVQGGQRLSTMTSRQKTFPVAPSKFKFSPHGESGLMVSELLPHTAKLVDEIALVRSVHTNAINHDPACTFVMSGSEQPGKPSIGSWLSYGLGSESNDLPAFVVFTPRFPSTGNGQALYNRLWGSGFLASGYSGVALRGVGDPVLYVNNPAGVDRVDRRTMLDALNKLNQRNYQRYRDPETKTRIAQYEMAYRMQKSVPELTNLSDEPKNILDMYGPDVNKPGSFAHSAIMSRRLVERGVRIVQLLHRGWDQHGNLPVALTNQCKDTDQATAALVADLKQRGLLDDTLVVWGGEFGRTVYSQGTINEKTYGRDHHPRNFCMWMAGGGIKGGVVHGETDDFSYNIVRDPVHVNDLNATILHCMGIDHERFSVKSQGLDQRLTGVEKSRVIRELLS